MKTKNIVFLSLLLFLLVSGCVKLSAPVSKTVTEDGYDRVILDNGMVVLMKEDHSKDVVAVDIGVPMSKLDEEIDDEYMPGLNDIMLTMMNYGTSSKDLDMINNKITELGIYFDVTSNDDYALISLLSGSAELKEALEIEFDILRNPSFPEDYFALIKDSAISDLESKYDSPNTLIDEAFMQALFGDSKFAHIMDEEDITKLKREYLFDQHARLFVPSNMVIAITGNFKKDVFLNNLAILAIGWTGDAPELVTSSNLKTHSMPETIELADPRVQSPAVRIGFMIPELESSRDALMLKIFSRELSSRLFKELREKEKGLSYSPYSALSYSNKHALFALVADTSVGNLEKVKNITEDLLYQFMEEGLDNKSFNDMKDSLVSVVKIAGETYEEQNSEALAVELSKYAMTKAEKIAVIESMTNKELITTAQKYLKNPVIVTLDYRE